MSRAHGLGAAARALRTLALLACLPLPALAGDGRLLATGGATQVEGAGGGDVGPFTWP
jgi:hypothetical protein